MVMAAPIGPVLDLADGAGRAGQPVPEWAGDQAVEQAADLSGGQRDGPWNVGVALGMGRRWGRRGGSAGHDEGEGKHGQGGAN
jgi:hypothetical protein